MEKELNFNAQQLEFLPFDKLEPDPENFYSLEGLNALADSISMQGLQNPILVRPVGDRFKKYRIVSGHRRHAAIKLLIDSGEEKWKTSVPCLVDRREMSDAFWQLMLISANSTTRVLTSAEQSRQAERTKELLYQLKEEGYAFPGRMENHVAEATGIAVAKLKRLSAIRNNLDKRLLGYYDEEKLNEDTAYQLQQLPAEIQSAVADELESGRRKKMPVGTTVKEVGSRLDSYMKSMPCRAHAGGPECHHHVGKVVRSIFTQYYWQVCHGNTCCMDCNDRFNCSSACEEAKLRARTERAAQKERDDEARKAEESRREVHRLKVIRRCKALLPLVDAAGMADKDKLFEFYTSASAGQVRKWATGDTEGRSFYDAGCVFPDRTSDARIMASRLGCTIDFVMGLSDDPYPPKAEKPEPAKEPEQGKVPEPVKDSEPQPAEEPETVKPYGWRTGTPTKKGRYLTWTVWGKWDPDYEIKDWDGEYWSATIDGETIFAWAPLPGPYHPEEEVEGDG